MRRKIVAGNWKLHGDRAFAAALVDAIAAVPAPAGVERVVLPPFPYIAQCVARSGGSGPALGAQDVSEHAKGAFTGEVSAAMLLTERFPMTVALQSKYEQGLKLLGYAAASSGKEDIPAGPALKKLAAAL